MRHSGIQIIGDVPWGTHFCQFYKNQQDLIDVLVPYFKAGLENNEFCMWVTSEPLHVEEAKAALAKEVPDLEGYFRKGQIEILDYGQWYTAGGEFEADRVLKGWVDKLGGATQRGFDGLRLTGNTFWLEKPDWQEFTEYEATVDRVIGQYRMLAICTYSLAKCGAVEIMDVVANHAFALIKRAGEWQVIESAVRKRTEEVLRKPSEDLDRRVAERTSEVRAASLYARSLIEVSLDPLVTISPAGRITDVNQATELVTGVARERLIGSSFSDYFTEPPAAEAGYQKVLAEGLAQDYPLTIRHVSGRTTDVLYNAVVYRNEAGKVQGVFAAARDVTERRRMEEKLRVASLYARSLIEASLDPLVTISPDGKITDVNVATELITGAPREHLIGTNFSDYFTEPREAELGYQRVLTQGLVRDYPLTIRHVSGRTTDVLYNATVYRDEAGRVQGVFAAARDVTERKRMEEQLRVASLYARSLIEASLDPLVTISPDGKVTDVNEATELVTGAPRERLIGSSFSDYFTEPPAAEAGYQKVLAEGLVQDYPLTIRHVSGRTTDVLYNAVVYRNEAGDVQGVFAAARDVTERKRVEAELARYRDHLEELVRQRTGEIEAANVHLQHMTEELARSNQELEQFAYVASHDLQEPLRAVTGYLGLFEQQLGEKLDDAGRHQVDGAIQGATRMHALITGLLALSRVGTQGHSFEAADLDSILDSALEGLRASVAEAGASITRDPLPTLPVDAIQMVQLFQNLIGNALKFRGEKPPEIHISAQQQPEQWVMAVRDNGIGIEPQYYDRIFLIFQRLHTRRLYPGTGIGLAICKKIVERHGGAMSVQSRPGQGSTFYFTIPKRDIPWRHKS